MTEVGRRFAGAAACVVLAAAVVSAAPCDEELLVIPPTRHPVYFSEQQEMDLGDAIAEHFEHFYNVVEDDTNQHLQALGERLLQQFPATELTFRFRLVNLPSANAFTIPGGRVYVARKLVALVKTEDELAGVIAHEIGHAIARHSVAVVSAHFRQAMDVTSFGDRRDIFDKYRQLADRTPRIHRTARHEEQEQIEADRLALVAVARAGYAPAALPELWDRLLQTEQRTGNFFTDLFGLTAPESRRLRLMLRSATGLRSECLTLRRPEGGVSFAEWQRRVIAGRPWSATRRCTRCCTSARSSLRCVATSCT